MNRGPSALVQSTGKVNLLDEPQCVQCSKYLKSDDDIMIVSHNSDCYVAHDGECSKILIAELRQDDEHPRFW